MSIWHEAFGAFVEGFADTVRSESKPSKNAGIYHVEALLRKLVWPIDVRPALQHMILFFTDREFGRRELSIGLGPSGTLAMFVLATDFPISEKAEILAYLLMRNAEMVKGAWEVRRGESSTFFQLRYVADALSLDAETLKFICNSLLTEVHTFESKMRSSNLF